MLAAGAGSVGLECRALSNLAEGAAVFCRVVGGFFGGRLGGRIVGSRSLSRRRRELRGERGSRGWRHWHPASAKRLHAHHTAAVAHSLGRLQANPQARSFDTSHWRHASGTRPSLRRGSFAFACADGGPHSIAAKSGGLDVWHAIFGSLFSGPTCGSSPEKWPGLLRFLKNLFRRKSLSAWARWESSPDVCCGAFNCQRAIVVRAFQPDLRYAAVGRPLRGFHQARSLICGA